MSGTAGNPRNPHETDTAGQLIPNYGGYGAVPVTSQRWVICERCLCVPPNCGCNEDRPVAVVPESRLVKAEGEVRWLRAALSEEQYVGGQSEAYHDERFAQVEKERDEAWQAGYKRGCTDVKDFDENLVLPECQEQLDGLREAMKEALASLETGPLKDGYAASTLRAALHYHLPDGDTGSGTSNPGGSKS